jgi:hypothetical protein
MYAPDHRLQTARGLVAVLRVYCCALTACMLVGAAAAAPPPLLQVQDAWIRWLPGNLPAGGYLRLRNDGNSAVVLVGASSPDYALVSLHRSLSRNGVSMMQPVESIRIEPHAELDFAAQGYHLMLAQPVRSLRPGDRVQIVLRFASEPALPVGFELRPADAGGPVAAMPGMPGMPETH